MFTFGLCRRDVESLGCDGMFSSVVPQGSRLRMVLGLGWWFGYRLTTNRFSRDPSGPRWEADWKKRGWDTSREPDDVGGLELSGVELPRLELLRLDVPRQDFCRADWS